MTDAKHAPAPKGLLTREDEALIRELEEAATHFITNPEGDDQIGDLYQRAANALKRRASPVPGDDAVERGNRIWFDTEFIEDGRTIDLISIGMVREDGARFYAECEECDYSRASPWVKENVLVHLKGGASLQPRRWIADSIVKFAGPNPEFWAYYADYDWVALCQLYGTMMDLPEGWPKFCRDVKQLAAERGSPTLPPDPADAHNALADALWTRDAWRSLAALTAAAFARRPPQETSQQKGKRHEQTTRFC